MNKSALVTLEMDVNDNGSDEFPEYLRQMILNYLQCKTELERYMVEKIVSDFMTESGKKVYTLAMAEVVLYNKKDLQRQLDNEERQRGKKNVIKKDSQNLE